MEKYQIKVKYIVDVLGKLYPFKVYAVVKTKDGKTEEKNIELKVGGFHNRIQKSTVESNAKYKAAKDGFEVLKINKIEALDKHVILK